jgi:hypothetical protein
MKREWIWSAAAVAGLAGVLAGCRVNVDKGANGEDKKVQVETPFGGLHVNTDNISASDLGLPAYPGAQPFVNNDMHKSADVHMGFGEWQLRVRAVSYSTTDPADQVLAFYKKALARYGDVLTCKDKEPVGTPTTTSEGLTCADDSNKGVHVNMDSDDGKNKGMHYNIHEGMELKAGSKRHQHIVGIEDKQENGKTVFSMVALDLPSGGNNGSD